MSGEQESEPESEANFYTSESQAQQSVPVHVCACTYTQIPEAAGWGKLYFQEYKKLLASNPAEL